MSLNALDWFTSTCNFPGTPTNDQHLLGLVSPHRERLPQSSAPPDFAIIAFFPSSFSTFHPQISTDDPSLSYTVRFLATSTHCSGCWHRVAGCEPLWAASPPSLPSRWRDAGSLSPPSCSNMCFLWTTCDATKPHLVQPVAAPVSINVCQ